jgi:hypothetical protein
VQFFMKLFNIKVIRLVSTFQLSKLWCLGVPITGPPAVGAKVEVRFRQIYFWAFRVLMAYRIPITFAHGLRRDYVAVAKCIPKRFSSQSL